VALTQPKTRINTRFPNTRAARNPGELRNSGQDAQVLRDGRLRNGELTLDHGADLTRGLLAVREELHDAPAHRFTEDLERVHD
jgi:hypothetical protein